MSAIVIEDFRDVWESYRDEEWVKNLCILVSGFNAHNYEKLVVYLNGNKIPDTVEGMADESMDFLVPDSQFEMDIYLLCEDKCLHQHVSEENVTEIIRKELRGSDIDIELVLEDVEALGLSSQIIDVPYARLTIPLPEDAKFANLIWTIFNPHDVPDRCYINWDENEKKQTLEMCSYPGVEASYWRAVSDEEDGTEFKEWFLLAKIPEEGDRFWMLSCPFVPMVCANVSEGFARLNRVLEFHHLRADFIRIHCTLKTRKFGVQVTDVFSIEVHERDNVKKIPYEELVPREY